MPNQHGSDEKCIGLFGGCGATGYHRLWNKSRYGRRWRAKCNDELWSYWYVLYKHVYLKNIFSFMGFVFFSFRFAKADDWVATWGQKTIDVDWQRRKFVHFLISKLKHNTTEREILGFFCAKVVCPPLSCRFLKSLFLVIKLQLFIIGFVQYFWAMRTIFRALLLLWFYICVRSFFRLLFWWRLLLNNFHSFAHSCFFSLFLFCRAIYAVFTCRAVFTIKGSTLMLRHANRHMNGAFLCIGMIFYCKHFLVLYNRFGNSTLFVYL